MENQLPIYLILNATAGGGSNAELVQQVTAEFNRHGRRTDITVAADGAALLAGAQRAIAQNATIVVAGGGDGTMNAVASVLRDSGVTLGVLPLGTLNHFAKDLQIPLELSAAVNTIVSGRRIQVDTGDVNGHIFLNNSSLGLYPDTVLLRENQQRHRKRTKWLAFFWAAIAVLRRYPFLNLTLSLEPDQPLRRRTPFLFIGNNEYAIEGFNLGARRRLDGGQLSLYLINKVGRLGLFSLIVRALFGQLRQSRDFDALAVQQLVIDSHHRQLRVATDGEVKRLSTPLQYRICRASLSVLVPRPPMDGGD